MKISKINNNKVCITLTIDELETRHISLKDIELNKDKAQNFFFEVLEESELNTEFVEDCSQLLIEATTENNDLFIITITKIDNIPDISKYYMSSNKPQLISYSVSSSIYDFNDVNNLIDFAKKAEKESLFLGINSLYSFSGHYFLIFSNTTIKKNEFIKTFCVLSEYADKYYSKPLYRSAIIEYSDPLLKKSAIQNLQKAHYVL